MTLNVTQRQASGLGRLFVKISVTDAFYSNPIFYLSDQAIVVTNVSGGAPAYAAVASWGALVKGGAVFSQAATADIDVDLGVEVVPHNQTVKATLGAWLRKVQYRDSVVQVYQWNKAEATQDVVWKGYLYAMTEGRYEDGRAIATLSLRSNDRTLGVAPLSTLATKENFSQMPTQGEGDMVPCVYGSASNTHNNTGNATSIAAIGQPFPGVRGIIVDENEATAKVIIRFAEGDTSQGALAFAEPTADDAGTSGDLCIWDESNGCYGMVDNASYSFTNDANKLEVTVDASPKVFFFVRPSLIGSTNAAAFTDSNKIIDSDPNNYVVSDNAGNHSWGFILPSVSFQGRVKSIGVLADWYNAHASLDRKLTIGIWDIYHAAAANWLNAASAKHKSVTRSSGLGQKAISYQDTAAWRYTSTNFGNHLGTATRDAFASGSFVTRNAGDALEAGLELRCFVEDIGGAHAGRGDVRLYNVGVIIEVDYPVVPKGKSIVWLGPNYWKQWEDDPLTWQEKKVMESYVERSFGKGRTALEERKEALSRHRGTDFFARGRFQKDDGSGTYSGTASDTIVRPSDIAHHILAKRKSKTCNTTAGTPGNFIDPRTHGLAKNAALLLPFGPKKVTADDAIDFIGERFGVTVYDENGTMQCLVDDMNPHSSWVYKSTSDPVLITENDIDIESFKWSEISADDLVNSVIFKYSHGYPNREAGARTTYENPLSQKWFGKKTTDPIEEPHVIQQNLESAAQSYATDLAQWYGRRTARPRLVVSCRLPQGFYDLRQGHFTGFKGLEKVGIECPAFRCGLVDYYFTSTSGGTDYADNGAHPFISLAGSSKLWIGLSQQVSSITFNVSVAAGYTTVANAWKYGSGGTSLSGVSNADALKSTGIQTVSFTMPNFWSWIKEEISLGGVQYGPCYWLSMDYNTPTATGTSADRTSHPAIWEGRRFTAIDVRRYPGEEVDDYPYVDGVFIEVH